MLDHVEGAPQGRRPERIERYSARRAASSCARATAQPPSRSGCTFTQTRFRHAFNSKVPRRPGIRRCQ